MFSKHPKAFMSSNESGSINLSIEGGKSKLRYKDIINNLESNKKSSENVYNTKNVSDDDYVFCVFT